MPPNKRKAPRRGAEGGESSSAALEDDLGDGDVEAWENAARDAARGQKAVMRKEHLDVLSTLRKWGKERLERGMKQWRTEAVGDCWLISLLAGSPGIDAQQAARFTDNQRNTLLTSWREKLVDADGHIADGLPLFGRVSHVVGQRARVSDSRTLGE